MALFLQGAGSPYCKGSACFWANSSLELDQERRVSVSLSLPYRCSSHEEFPVALRSVINQQLDLYSFSESPDSDQ